MLLIPYLFEYYAKFSIIPTFIYPLVLFILFFLKYDLT